MHSLIKSVELESIEGGDSSRDSSCPAYYKKKSGLDLYNTDLQ